MSTAFDARLAARLAALDRQGRARRPPRIAARSGVRYRLDDRDVVGLCSNDYLGFSDHAALVREQPMPPGAAASRLVAGDLEIHRHAEQLLAQHVGAADSVLFPSGFQLNVGVLPALLGSDDHAYSDALNHASLIDGLRLSAARRTVAPHGAPPPPPHASASGLSWWITETIFSMDGDRADCDALAQHVRAGGCLYVDEAHAYGLFAGGRGLAAALNVPATATVCTLGKAFGCAGAFVAGSTTMCRWLRATARSFVFTTGTSPELTHRVCTALDLVRGPVGDERRRRLWSNVAHLAGCLGVPDGPSPIFPIVLGDDALTVAIAEQLLERGWHVQPIRPPTVPEGTARLRVTVSAVHEPAQLEHFAHDLRTLLCARDLPLCVARGLASPAALAHARAVS